MLNRDFTRRVRLLRGKVELITFRYTIGEDDRLVEHVTMEVPQPFLDLATPKPSVNLARISDRTLSHAEISDPRRLLDTTAEAPARKDILRN